MEEENTETRIRDPKRELSYLIAKHFENNQKIIESNSPPSFSPASETLSIQVEFGDSECYDHIYQFDGDIDGDLTKGIKEELKEN